jgi:hypothetical protein
LPPCPPTTELANSDKNFTRDGFWSDYGKFEWKLIHNSYSAFYHPGADFCARAKNTNYSAGGRQQCCYKGANILLGPPGLLNIFGNKFNKFPKGGGTEDTRGDQFGHIREDIHPWFLCCRGQSNQTKADELCQLYYQKRPSNDGNDYQT